MTTRYDIERAVEKSRLHPVARHIILVLCTRMQVGSTTILQQHSPSLTRLARGTGWSRRTIQRYLNYLEEAKWIERHRPLPELARTVYLTTLYVVHEPDTLGTQGPALESGGPGLEPGRTGALESGGPGLEPGRTASQISSDLISDQEIEMVVTELEKRTGRTVTREFAAKTRDLILARPGIQHRAAYLRRVLTTDPDPGRFLPTDQPPPFHAPPLFRSPD